MSTRRDLWFAAALMGLTVGFTVLLLLLPRGAGPTPGEVRQIVPGTSLAEIEKLLGPPSRRVPKDGVGVADWPHFAERAERLLIWVRPGNQIVSVYLDGADRVVGVNVSDPED